MEFAVYRKLFQGDWRYNVVFRDRKYKDKKNKDKYPELYQNFKTSKSFQKIQSDDTWCEGNLDDILTDYNFEWMYTYHSYVHPEYKNEIKEAVDNSLSYLMDRWDREIDLAFDPINET